jgi:DNA-binding CsgD family transcriptional regulator
MKNTHPFRLSPEILKAMDLLAQGFSEKEVARKLRISYATVKTQLQRAIVLTGARSVVQLAVWWHCELFQIGLGRERRSKLTLKSLLLASLTALMLLSIAAPSSAAIADTGWSPIVTPSTSAFDKTAAIERARWWWGFRLRRVKPHLGCIELDSTPLFIWDEDDDYECT